MKLANLISWIYGQVLAAGVGWWVYDWQDSLAPGLFAWAVICILVDIRKAVSE